MRYIKRLDSTQKEIVEALRKAGYSVRSTAMVGGGFPDIVVGCSRGNVLLEAKSKRAHKDELVKDDAFARGWQGPIYRVYSAEEALNAMRLYSADDLPF